ncbi:MAG: redox-sensing transcriptional repressor Rex [Firmicutes bacterium]|nr:redox-sensing transcriptional repressor Rex [Bacillota bacterium]
MAWKRISDAVIRRLPLYLRVLEEVKDKQISISSQELGDMAGVRPALVRKDLAWFGEFGKQGVGYDVEFLQDELRKILHLDEPIHMALVGVGSLGHALARYHHRRFMEDPIFTIKLVALFDVNPNLVGATLDSIPIFHPDEIAAVVPDMDVQMAIITVPSDVAQETGVALAQAGVKAILNFAPVNLEIPGNVHVANADLSLELQRLAYYIGT